MANVQSHQPIVIDARSEMQRREDERHRIDNNGEQPLHPRWRLERIFLYILLSVLTIGIIIITVVLCCGGNSRTVHEWVIRDDKIEGGNHKTTLTREQIEQLVNGSVSVVNGRLQGPNGPIDIPGLGNLTGSVDDFFNQLPKPDVTRPDYHEQQIREAEREVRDRLTGSPSGISI
uniref:Uncharacterized protein n=1 Tax=Babesia bovis TaxID=5865 RepID=S6BIE9_BABBO|nr:hypothetical protein [Babesia bovis]